MTVLRTGLAMIGSAVTATACFSSRTAGRAALGPFLVTITTPALPAALKARIQ